MGETHLGIALERLHRKLGVEVETEDVKVAYRETITHEAEAEGKYKKQTGGHGQFGVAFVRVEPLERGGGFEFVDQIVGGAIPRQFIPAVEKGVARDDGAGRRLRLPRRRREGDLLRRQVPLGRLVGDELQDGRLASASRRRWRRPTRSCSSRSASSSCTAPEANQGDIMGDLNSKRGRIQGSSAVGQRRGRGGRAGARPPRCCATPSTSAR